MFWLVLLVSRRKVQNNFWAALYNLAEHDGAWDDADFDLGRDKMPIFLIHDIFEAVGHPFREKKGDIKI